MNEFFKRITKKKMERKNYYDPIKNQKPVIL